MSAGFFLTKSRSCACLIVLRSGSTFAVIQYSRLVSFCFLSYCQYDNVTHEPRDVHCDVLRVPAAVVSEWPAAVVWHQRW